MRQKHKLDFIIELEQAIEQWQLSGSISPLCLVGPPAGKSIGPRVAKVVPVQGSRESVIVIIGSEKPVTVSKKFAVEHLFRGGFTTLLEDFEVRRERNGAA